MSTHLPRLAIIGSGALGTAVIEGLQRAEIVFDDGWIATTRSEAGLARVPIASGLERISAERTPEANLSAASGARIVLIAVRPQDVLAVVDEIAPVIDDQAIVISLAAAPGLARLREHLGDGPALARMMPNTAVRVLAGVVGLSFETDIDQARRALAHLLSAPLGQVLALEEPRLDVLTGVLGAQALLYEFTDVVREAISSQGFTPAQAAGLATQLLTGAAAMTADGTQPTALRDGLATPGGTTEKGLAVLERAKLRAVVRDAVNASVHAADTDLTTPPRTHE